MPIGDSVLDLLKNPATAVFLIPIAAIVVGGVIALFTMYTRHRERMAMIERGMNPDASSEEEDEDT